MVKSLYTWIREDLTVDLLFIVSIIALVIMWVMGAFIQEFTGLKDLGYILYRPLGPGLIILLYGLAVAASVRLLQFGGAFHYGYGYDGLKYVSFFVVILMIVSMLLPWILPEIFPTMQMKAMLLSTIAP